VGCRSSMVCIQLITSTIVTPFHKQKIAPPERR
jgi:hypothetical protein